MRPLTVMLLAWCVLLSACHTTRKSAASVSGAVAATADSTVATATTAEALSAILTHMAEAESIRVDFYPPPVDSTSGAGATVVVAPRSLTIGRIRLTDAATINASATDSSAISTTSKCASINQSSSQTTANTSRPPYFYAVIIAIVIGFIGYLGFRRYNQ